MRYYADFHLHSKYSRACSEIMDIPHLVRFGKMKGLNLYGAGDFTHPKWFEYLKETLAGGEGGVYEREGVKFVVTGEISLIYSQAGKVRKVHLVVMLPSLDAAGQVNDVLGKTGNLKADGRPILGMNSIEFVEKVVEAVPEAMIVPAHAWTPWFSMFGSMSGFNSMKDCFQDQLKHIFAVETGLSSDPAMNWRVSELDRMTLLSNSDSHSPWPHRIGREANVFELKELTYKTLYNAIKNKDLLFTIETDPAYGKYHWDGHRSCGVSMSPDEARRLNNVCPACGKGLTIGVEHRVEELADRPAGFKPEGAIPFRNLLPLAEIISKVIDKGVATKSVWSVYEKAVRELGVEYGILLDVSEDDLRKSLGDKIAGAVMAVRNNQVVIKPGFDGVYGEASFEKEEKQKGLGRWF